LGERIRAAWSLARYPIAGAVALDIRTFSLQAAQPLVHCAASGGIGMADERSGEELAFLELSEFARQLGIKYYGLVVIAQSGPKVGSIVPLYSKACETNAPLFEKLVGTLQNAIKVNRRSNGPIVVIHSLREHQFYSCILQQVYDRRIGFLWMLPRGRELQSQSLIEVGKRVEQTIRDSKRLSLYSAIVRYADDQENDVRNPYVLLGNFIANSIAPHFMAIWIDSRDTMIRNFVGYKTAFSSDGEQHFIAKGTGLVDVCFERGHPFRVDDLADAQYLKRVFGRPLAIPELREAKALRSALYYPIKIENSVDGVIGLYFSRPCGATNVESEMLQSIVSLFMPELRFKSERDHAREIRKRYGRFGTKFRYALLVAETIHRLKDDINALRNWLSEISPKSQQDDTALKRARSAANRIAALISQSKATIGGSDNQQSFFLSLSAEQLGLRDQVDFCVAKFKTAMVAYGIQVANNIQKDLMLNCRPELIEAILDNAISNAVKALMFVSGKKPEITISAVAQENGLTLSIRDNGPGLEPGLEDIIFEPFFTTNQKDSMGIGLAIVRSATEELGGKVRIKSTWASSFELIVDLPLTLIYKSKVHVRA
jgi:signal transduction histidine kinase